MNRDSGLQPERTALAWQRTGLSAGMVSLLTTLTAIQLGMLPLAVISAIVAASTMVVALVHFPPGTLHSSGKVNASRPLTRIVLVVSLAAALGVVIAITSLLTS